MPSDKEDNADHGSRSEYTTDPSLRRTTTTVSYTPPMPRADKTSNFPSRNVSSPATSNTSAIPAHALGSHRKPSKPASSPRQRKRTGSSSRIRTTQRSNRATSPPGNWVSLAFRSSCSRGNGQSAEHSRPRRSWTSSKSWSSAVAGEQMAPRRTNRRPGRNRRKAHDQLRCKPGRPVTARLVATTMPWSADSHFSVTYTSGTHTTVAISSCTSDRAEGLYKAYCIIVQESRSMHVRFTGISLMIHL